ncbi:MAG TPA: hypothetical protein DCM28_09105 [Phycisphaerales bacterium]|nr:hypothetical protein [Phycisphaerales bacterium]HCD35337.1 hypothetical protein [Phycisphaerales bacterium]|tara:strand:+ start:134503 stop:135474 length:972 start_codon:yes stop_codon:yes gene_type:complete
MSITRLLIVLFVLVTFTLPAMAEDAAKSADKPADQAVDTPTTQPAKPTDEAPRQTIQEEMKLITSVVQVLDRRSSIKSILNSCMVELLFIGKPLELVIGVDHIDLSKAVDDKGNDLIDTQKQVNRSLGQDDMLRNSGSQPANSTGMTVQLKNPPRDASQIKTLKGIAHFVLKSVEGKDYVNLTDFLEPSGKAIASDALKDRGVELTYLPPQWIKDWAAKKGDELTSGILPAHEMAGLLPLIEGLSKQSQTVTLIPMLVNDPKKQLAQVQVTSKDGPLRRIQFETVTVFVSMTGKPQSPTLEVNLKSDDTTMSLPFEITDIPLP